MAGIKTILVAVDMSDHSLPALKYAGRLAWAVHAKLLVVTVVNQRDIYAIQEALQPYDEVLCEQIISEKITDCGRWLDNLIQTAGVQAISKAILREGRPHEEILKIVESAHPDLVVMGAKGRSSLADAIVGSCAQKMFRRCPIPLLRFRQQEPDQSEKKD
ncbi:universal stress protein [Desulfobacter curvatus]|uniref:universal stress protein n=1 Tax=Desulfobacter curvatus TaxID=2290 RepID=UPI0003752464|nr:universal stress protein [Desulfobacter curvatus]